MPEGEKNGGARKGQLISKCLFGVFKFLQKMNENKPTWGIIVVKLIFFVRFFGRIEDTKNPFEINWQLVTCEDDLPSPGWNKVNWSAKYWGGPVPLLALPVPASLSIGSLSREESKKKMSGTIRSSYP